MASKLKQHLEEFLKQHDEFYWKVTVYVLRTEVFLKEVLLL